jgi:hypothetical protein
MQSDESASLLLFSIEKRNTEYCLSFGPLESSLFLLINQDIKIVHYFLIRILVDYILKFIK